MLIEPGNSPAGAASPLYPIAHRPDLFIDRLRAGLVVGRLGATVLSDLVGDQEIPRQTGSATAQWLGEDEAISDTALSFDDVKLSPRTVGAITSYSRRTLINASPSVETIVRNDLAAVIANAIDKAAMLGDGSGNTPIGIMHQSGVAPSTLSAPPSWAEVLSFPTAIQMLDADIAALGWAMAPDAVAKFRSTLREANTAAMFLMTDPGSLAGYPAAVTTSLSTGNSSGATSTVLFGCWAQLLVGYWSGIDLLVNPYADSAYARGRVLLRVMRDCDVAVRHPEAFTYAEMDI
jgi:HK97 family phage major capsid protein